MASKTSDNVGYTSVKGSRRDRLDSWRFSEKRERLVNLLRQTVTVLDEVVKSASGSHPHTKKHAHACSSALEHMIAMADFKKEQPLSYVFIGPKSEHDRYGSGSGSGSGPASAGSKPAATCEGEGESESAAANVKDVNSDEKHRTMFRKKERTIAYSIADNTRRLLISFIVARRRYIDSEHIDALSKAVNEIKSTYFD